MKNFTYSLLPALFSFLFFSTNPNPTDINNQIEVDEVACLQVEAEQEEEIKTFSLFNVTQNKGAKSEHLRGGVYLDLSVKDLNSLYKERPRAINFTLPTEEHEIELNLYEQQIFTDDFAVRVASDDGKSKFPYKKGLHYAGTVAGEPNSLVTISIFESKVIGILSMGRDNYNLGPMNQFSADAEETYVFYKERDLKTPPQIKCRVENSTPALPLGDLTGELQYAGKQANVVKIYIEADFDMYKDNGNSVQNTMDFTAALFNEVAKLYANEQILTRIQECKVWDVSDPYPNSSSNAALNAFRDQVGGTYPGDLAHLISTASGNNGGLAALDVLCFKSRGHAYSNIRDSYLPVPTYSWSVEVFTHEMGHNLGCPHTQSCSWGPSNNSALDDCYATEGSCGPGPTPANGGTIMSYCHLSSVGINFNNGFGVEPGNLIRRKVALAGCLEEVFDCFSKIELEPGITYRGDSRNGGATDFNDYACGPNIQHRGNEIAHVFKPEVSGMAFITYTENIPEQMNLMMVPECKPEDCVTFWEGAPLVRDSFMAIGGEEYTFITDVVEANPGGEYTLRISFPNAACQTGNILEEGIIFSGNSKDNGTANIKNYGCNSTNYLGNEVGHSFTPDADGRAYLYYSENLPEQMDLFLLSACDANQCTKSWTGAPNVRDSFDVVANETYFFFTDTKEDSEGGRYEILISFPGSGCATTVSLANGVTYSGNTSDGSANFVSYACPIPAQTGSEVGHYFVSASDGKARLQFNGPGLTLIQSDACNPDNCYKTYSSGNVDEEIDIIGLESYYFIVDGPNAGSSAYDITITMQPQNNSCLCEDPLNDICENFDAYDLGNVSAQSACQSAGNADGTVVIPTGTFGGANSGENSMSINNGQSTVLTLGNRTFGSYIMKFAFRADVGKNAYFKLYHVYDPDNPANNEEAFDVTIINEPAAGVSFGRLYQGNPIPTSTAGNFGPLPIWKEFVFDIDLDKDSIKMVYSGSTVAEWNFSNFRLGTGGQNILGAIEFYSDNSNTEYLIDDFRLYSNEEGFCETSAGIYCEDFDTYRDDQKVYVRNNPDEWSLNDTTSSSPLVGSSAASTFQSASGALSMEVRSGQAGAPFDDVVCYPFGQNISPSGGKLKQSMQVFVPFAATGNLRTYHTFSLDSNPTNDIVGSSVHFGLNGIGEVISGGVSSVFAYDNNAWLDYVQLIDFDNDIATIFIQGIAVATFPYSNTVSGAGSNSDYAGMGFNCIDGQGARRQGVRFYIDNIEVIDQSLFLNIDPADMYVDFPTGSGSVSVTSNLTGGWIAESQDPWLSVKNVTSTSFDVEWEENVEISNRVGEVTVDGTGASRKTLTVTQIGADPILIVDPAGPITVDPDGETNLQFNVTANVRWGVNSNDATWIVVPPDSGNEGNATFTIDVERNLGGARSDTLFVEGDPAGEVAIILNQAEGSKFVGVASDTICLMAIAGSIDFELDANTNWTINNNSGWFTTSPNSGSTTETIQLNYQSNPTANDRYYDLLISSTDAPDFTLVVKQVPEAPFMTADPLVIPVGVPSGTESFDISSNVDWTLCSTATWFSLSTLNGSGTETVTINYDQNADPFDRNDTIFVKGSNGVAELAIVVRQDGAGNLLSATPTDFNVGVPSGEVTSVIESNIGWTAKTTDLWLTLNGMNDEFGPFTGPGDLVIGYEENNTTSARTGTITLTGPGVAAVTIRVNQDGGVSTLCLDPTVIDVDSQAGTFDFNVIANVPNWTMTVDVNWLGINRNGGSGNASVTATYSENTVSTSRTAIITISAPGMPDKILTVTQTGQGFVFEVDQDTMCVNEMQQEATFNVTTSNLFWTVTDDAPWMQIKSTTTSGFGNGPVTAQIFANTGPTRYANVIVEVAGEGTRTVVIKQTGTAPILTVSPMTINVTAPAGFEEFDITSNGDWTISSPDSWIKNFDPTSGSAPGANVDFEYEENTSTAARTGTIVIEGGGISRTITVNQEGVMLNLTVSPTEINVPAPLTSRIAKVTASADWMVESNNTAWLTVTSPASGEGTSPGGDIEITIEENTDVAPRTGTLTVTLIGTTNTETITVNQEGATANLSVGQTTFMVNAPEGSESVDILSNKDWTASTNDTWLTLSPTSGSGNGTLDFEYAENTDVTSRVGTITLSAPGCPDVTVTVEQGGTAANLSVNQTVFMVNAPAGSESVDVSSNKNWMVTTNDSWINLSPTSGSGNGTLMINYDENTDLTERNGTITLTAPGCPDVNIMVNQQGASAVLSVDPTMITVNAPAGTESLDITSNKDWTLETSETWITLSTDNGSNNATVNFDYEENTDVATRTGTITLSAPGCADINITVNQNAAGVIFTVSDNDFQVEAPSGTETVDINSNLDWSVKISEPWITVTPMMGSGDGTITINYDENTSLDTRVGTVTLCATGQPDQVITITQLGVAPTLSVDRNNISVDQPSGNETVVISSNTEWTIKSTSSWVTFNPTSGTGDASVAIQYLENPDMAERTAIITVCSPDLPDQTIEFTQSGRAGNLSVNPSVINVDAPASTETFDISADVDWTIKTTANWLSFTPDSGSGDATITVSIDGNIDTNQRTGVITICSPGLTDRLVTITQAGAVARQLSVNPTVIDLPANPGGSRTINVTSNIDWQFVVAGGWLMNITPTNNMGSMNGVIEFDFPENTGSAGRSATITVSGVGVPDQLITINQAGVNFNLEVDKDVINLTADAGSNGFVITSNVDWQISDDAANDWITTYSTDNGNGNSNITFDYEANPDLNQRTATITVQGVGTPSRTILVTQAGRNAMLEADPSEFNVDAAATTEAFNITSNAGWMLSASAGWVNNFTTLMGSGNETIAFSIDENTTGSSRSTIITLSGGGLTKDIVVNQAAPDFFLDAEPPVINLPASAGNDKFTVVSNVAWDIDIPASATGWLTPAVTSGNNTGDVNFTYDENTGANVRSAIVTISGPGVASKTVEINQQGTVPLNLSVSPMDVTKTSVPGNQIFNITSNADWQVCTDAPWVTLTPETGSNNGFFVASFSANPTADDRVATIIIKSPGLPDVSVTITQSGFSPFLDADEKDFLVGSFQGTIDINVMSNVSWTVDPQGATWIEDVNSSFFGMDNDVVTVRYQTNPNSGPRTATLRLSTPVQGVPPVFIEITQSETNSTKELQKLYDLNLFPNPVSEDLNIDFQLLRGEDLTIDILDMTGKVLDVISEDYFRANRIRISHNVNNLAQGVYVLRFKSEVGIITKRFIVN